MYSFGRGNTKNASDIQITADALELATTRPDLTRFVLVTGDAGFAPVANKLRNHGKIVAGAAYDSAIGAGLFKAVCGDGNWQSLPAPPEPAPEPTRSRPQSPHGVPGYGLPGKAWKAAPHTAQEEPGASTATLREQVEAGIEPVDPQNPAEALDALRRVLHVLLQCPAAQSSLAINGLEINHFTDAAASRVIGYTPARCGFERHHELLASLVTETAFQLIVNSHGNYRILHRASTPPKGFGPAGSPAQPAVPATE